jgi:hypothetical protein
MEFATLTIVSIIVVISIMRYSLKSREINPMQDYKNILLFIVLEIICMLLGKYGANWELPWWIYYTVPMILTMFFPIIYFRMRSREILTYLILTFISAPLIHIIFSFFIGWKNYMPFIRVPSIWETF